MSNTLTQQVDTSNLDQYILADDLTPHLQRLEASLTHEVQKVDEKNHLSIAGVIHSYLDHISFLKTSEEEIEMLKKSPDARSYTLNVPACKHILYEAQKGFLTVLARFITLPTSI
ncbi:MAG: hypothetical protein WCO78_02835 [Candidatus Roizmanbacteria bacterium]